MSPARAHRSDARRDRRADGLPRALARDGAPQARAPLSVTAGVVDRRLRAQVFFMAFEGGRAGGVIAWHAACGRVLWRGERVTHNGMMLRLAAIGSLSVAMGCSATVSTSDASVADQAPVDRPADGAADAPDTPRPPRVPLRHRATATACPSTRPASMCDPGVGSGPPLMCRSDSECTAGTNGRCVGNPHDGCRCNYDACSTDGDCMNAACECRLASRGAAGANVCIPGNCRVDADCGVGGYCSPTLGSCGDYGGLVGYYCHTARDECVDDADCATVLDGGFLGQRPYCMYSQEVGRWVCSNSGCAG